MEFDTCLVDVYPFRGTPRAVPDLRRASNNGSVVSKAAYLEAVSDVGDADIAEWVQKAVAEEGANLILTAERG